MGQTTDLNILLQEAGLLELNSGTKPHEPLLSPQQQSELMSLVRVDDPDTKRQIIAHNLRLVVNIAKRYNDHGVALFELIREGAKGLIHALENFDIEGGFRFATYAARCVRNKIEHAIIEKNERLSVAAFQGSSSMMFDIPL